MKAIGYPNTKPRRVWAYTRQKSLNTYGRSDLVSRGHFSKKTKAGLGRRKARATELRSGRANIRKQFLPFRKHGLGGTGLKASGTYSNIMKLKRGYA